MPLRKSLSSVIDKLYMKKCCIILLICLCALTISPARATANPDTLRVMAYNVLYYGNGCQGPNLSYHGYLKTICDFTRPDILSLEKVASIPLNTGDKAGKAKLGFADSVLRYALNGAATEKYKYCPFTNEAQANNTCLLFYNQQKLGYSGTVSTYVNGVDFNTYKLYYKATNLSVTNDTIFIYVTPNHNKSGDEFEVVRTMQMKGLMEGYKKHFRQLGNHLSLGDFNTRSSEEGCYRLLINEADMGFRFFDPPFYPDRQFTYPANWDHEGKYSSCFTTSTRESANVPNRCGSGGGAKGWYDHIFISRNILNNTDRVAYIPHSYRTIGNDGQRFRVSILNKNVHENRSAPPDVLQALYQMSNKYPVMIDLAVDAEAAKKGTVVIEKAGVATLDKEVVNVAEPLTDKLTLHLPEAFLGQEITVALLRDGRQVWEKTFIAGDSDEMIKCKAESGSYLLRVSGHHNVILERQVNKQ